MNLDRRISLDEVQRAVMDLGFFPTGKEIEQMHATLGSKSHERIESQDFEDGADLQEFLGMVQVLSLKEMGSRTIMMLHSIFMKHCDMDEHLDRQHLANLMRALGHPEDEVELEFLMREWDIAGNGYLDFDAFVSIVAHVVKSEELDAQLEQDFLTLAGENLDEGNVEAHLRTVVTASDITRMARNKGLVIDMSTAEEMVYDADESGEGHVTLDNLINCVETVGENEALEDLEENKDRGGSSDSSSSGSGSGSARAPVITADSMTAEDHTTRQTDHVKTPSTSGRKILAAQRMNRQRDSVFGSGKSSSSASDNAQ